eukprot:10579-Heterococcus_DN1.PRE.2
MTSPSYCMIARLSDPIPGSASVHLQVGVQAAFSCSPSQKRTRMPKLIDHVKIHAKEPPVHEADANGIGSKAAAA